MQLRVLLFEDDDSVRQLIGGVLRQRGCEVMAFPCPSLCEVVNSSTCECPDGTQCADIIITDRMLGQADGVELLKKQLQRGCKARFMAIMSSAMSPADFDWLDENDIRSFQKPFPLPDLIAWLDECEANMDVERKLVETDDQAQPIVPR